MSETGPKIYPEINSSLDIEVPKSAESNESFRLRLDLILESRRNQEKIVDVLTSLEDQLCSREELQAIADWLNGSGKEVQQRVRQHLRWIFGKPNTVSDTNYGTTYPVVTIHGRYVTVEDWYFGDHPNGANWLEADRPWRGQMCVAFPEK